MAGLQVVRDAVFLTHYREVVSRDRLHLEALIVQVVGIPFAAAALRVLVEDNVAPIRRGSGAQRDHAGSPADQRGPASPADEHRQERPAAQPVFSDFHDLSPGSSNYAIRITA